METARHSMLDNKVQLYMRPNSPHWQSSCSIGGRQRRMTTKEESLARAKDVARDWYLGLMGKYRAGDLKEGVTFRQAGEQFLKEYEVITLGERNAGYVKGHGLKLRKHLYPFLGDKVVTDITPGVVQEYRLFRLTPKKDENGNVIMDPHTGLPKRPARSTLHQEIITLNHVLKTANRHGWLPFLPNIAAPYKTSGKIGHRAWFTKDEYETLYKHMAKRAENPPHNRGRWKEENEDLQDYILFMTNTGLRPDEARRLQFRDIKIVNTDKKGETILEIAVRGKRGTGWCMSMPGAVYPFQRMVERHNYQPKDHVFPRVPRELLNSVLSELDLKFDREGNRRTAYSFRHTYFCFRLMDGADIYQLAKNGRTSVEMLEKYYVIHLKDMIDTSAVNIRKSHSTQTEMPKN